MASSAPAPPPADISTDYLIIGAGIAGLGFADELLTRTSATITIVDKRDAPGGHWNDAYSFVKLHGPANMYGVESTALSDDHIEQHGLNKGMMTLSSGPEILAYCSRIVETRFLASGRVTYLPSTEYVESEGTVRGLFSWKRQTVKAKKIVDARYCENSIPLTHKPSFSTAPSVHCIPPNGLPRAAAGFQHFTVLGAGKTAVDACIWLLTNGVDAQRVRWIVPNDYWYLNRAKSQVAMPFFDDITTAIIDRFEAMAEATDALDLARRLEKCEAWLRVDTAVEPLQFHSAVISKGEMAELRKIRDVVRKGYVSAIQADKVVLTQGTIPAPLNTLYVDCTACAFPGSPPVPIFQHNKIVLQIVRSAMPGLSVALIAFIEFLGLSDEERNDLVKPVPYAKGIQDYLTELSVDVRNSFHLSKFQPTREWSAQSRLDVFSSLVTRVPPEDVEKREKLARLMKVVPVGIGSDRIRKASKPAVKNLKGMTSGRIQIVEIILMSIMLDPYSGYAIDQK
ncbi:hypothetical protein NLU13_2867 [Sarocladium strictum]|uniref:FAD/NAD(P)-binding domain-containing protein n=1 Tax=Sarocladium strictum TaxID=5046 RepID=A0AA39GNM4_SARSR|nr:hypothetical protein NLU13_2867 [Sarocladium strictum]